jgi:hypothetical protein
MGKGPRARLSGRAGWCNVSALAVPVERRAHERPAYDNARVANFASWCFDNWRELIRWWWVCDVEIRSQSLHPGIGDDFDAFVAAQHEREAINWRRTR